MLLFSDMLMPGTSKTAAQVANFMRNSQTSQYEIQQVLMQDPRLAVLFTQALATMNTAIDPISDSRASAVISNLMEHVCLPFSLSNDLFAFRNPQYQLGYHIPLFRV